MPLHVVTIVGMSIVFLIFVILYATFRTMGYVFEVSRRRRGRKEEEVKREEIKVEEADGEIVVVIAAVLSQVLGEKHKIISVKPVKKRGYTIWRRTGWKGVRKWQGSSRLW
ncbi:MAG: OadG family protein [Thermotogaceae bacterium]|nr:OadG family protein [Thermotogaceae bacterium]